jgi:hypothetical protein
MAIIEASCGLVEDDYLGLNRQYGSYSHPLTFPLGQGEWYFQVIPC